jgi:hypothetical protein
VRTRVGVDHVRFGCGFEVGTISLPSGAMIRLRPPPR